MLLRHIEATESKLLKDYTENLFNYENSPMIQRKLNCGQTYSKTHAEQQATTLRLHILPFFGEMEPDAITIPVIDSWLMYLKGKGLSNSSIAHYIITLRVIFKELMRVGIIEKNPLDLIEGFSKKAKEKDILTDDEMNKLFDFKKLITVWNGNIFYYTICYLAAKTGVRLGEAQALKKDAIGKDHIIVRHSWARHHGLKGTKNGKNRNIPITPELKMLLDTVAKTSESDFVFSLPGSLTPVDHKIVYKYLYRAFRNIGISNEDRKKRRLSYHNFRHYVNTKLIENGTPLPIIQAITGHSDIKMTQHYFHANAENCRKYLSKV